LIDISDDGISAVYTFYEPDNKNSLGHYGILCQLDLCKITSKPWLYLGYWVDGCDKLSYKMDYQPAEIFRDGHWIPYNQG
ncbi:MAG: arginyltransferase, partial [Alcaligenaceae bacterium]|nr:arginyltransferase [Alcaligenaceae bacterium]